MKKMLLTISSALVALMLTTAASAEISKVRMGYGH